MKSTEFKEFIQKLDLQEFENYYRNNPNRKVLEKFQISDWYLEKILDYFGIVRKTKQESDFLIKQCFQQKSVEEKYRATEKRLKTRSKWTEEYKNSVNRRISETKKNISDDQKEQILKKFRKTNESKSDLEKQLTRQRKSQATKKHFKNMSEKDRQAFSEKMSQVYKNLPDEVKENRKKKITKSYKDSCLKKYGVVNTFKLKEVQEKTKKTVLERYGVEYCCQLPQCRLSGNDSSVNLNFKNLLIQNNLYENDELNREFNIDKFSYDFKIGNNLIELDPSATHNSTWSPFPNQEKSKEYHFNKSKLARESGYRCIHVFDWDDKNKIIQMLLPKETIYARKCEIREIDLNTAREYLNNYHLQGYAKDKIRIGLFYNDLLVSIMTFGKPRYNKNYEYELIRYCSSYNVIGGSEKLFKYFIRKYNPSSIISYCDWSKFNGDVYYKLGFTFKNYSIGRHWYHPIEEIHITDNLLRQRGFDQLFGTDYGKGTSNEQLMKEHGFVEIYDSGQAVFGYRKN